MCTTPKTMIRSIAILAAARRCPQRCWRRRLEGSRELNGQHDGIRLRLAADSASLWRRGGEEGNGAAKPAPVRVGMTVLSIADG